jgi:hypothetical protein
MACVTRIGNRGRTKSTPSLPLRPLVFRGVVVDASAMERIFEASGVDWTILRPPQLTDKPHTGKYRVREAHLPPFGFKISRAEVADCFLKAVADPASIRKVLGVSH